MDKPEYVLVTGGLGYIGSHTVVKLSEAGYEPVIVDNLSTSRIATLSAIQKICKKNIKCEIFDVRDSSALASLLHRDNITSIIHFAAYKSVEESCRNPDLYYENNVGGTISILRAIEDSNVDKLVFSSSCTVYGPLKTCNLKYRENSSLDPISPYGRSKMLCEGLLQLPIINKTRDRLKTGILRYFNPVGAHSSYLIGEYPANEPSCLMPRLAYAATGLLPRVEIYGTDYETPDGSCVRDFIHVEDVADAHIYSLKALGAGKTHICNIGTGFGYSVLEVIREFNRVNQLSLNIKYANRRSGDIPYSVADTQFASELLGWRATRSLEDMCFSSWEWQKKIVQQQEPSSV